MVDDKKDDIKDLKGEKRSLQDDLADANDEMIEACNHLADIEEQIRIKNAQIEQNQADLADAIEREAKQKNDMEIRVRKMYERKNSDRSGSHQQIL